MATAALPAVWGLLAVFLCHYPGSTSADGNSVPGGVAGVAATEVQKRQHQVEAAQTLFAAGSRASADKSYGEAMDNFKAAFETMPEVPAVESQRIAFFKRYQSSAHLFANQLIEEARWAEAEQTLSNVLELAQQGGISVTLIDPDVRKTLGELKNHDDRFNQALSPRHLRDIETVESQLIVAKGYLELGDYDRAERAYHRALNVDPYNEAARHGLEEVERYKMNYYDAARDHTRAKKLAEVSAAWESPVPPIFVDDSEIGEVSEVAGGGKVMLEKKLRDIVIPSLEFNNARLADVIEFLVQKSQELDTLEPDPLKKGVNIIVDSSGSLNGEDLSQSVVSIRLSRVPLGVALKYVAQKVGMKYRVDQFAVTVIPESVSENTGMVTETFEVPPGFLNPEGAGGGAAGPTDPFSTTQESAGNLVKRIDAQTFLTNNGVVFPDGSYAKFISATSRLVVRNTPQQMETVRNLVQSARDSGEKLAKISIRMISVKDVVLRQLGMDFLLGPSNLGGSTPRVFAAGGTDGNVAVPTDPANFPFVSPNGAPVGMNPVTSGLRMGDLATNQSIEDVINRDNPTAATGRAPGTFAISGVFTDPQFQSVFRLLSQQKGVDTMCNIHVTTKPGQLARVEQVREFIYPTEYDPPEIPNETGVIPDGANRRLVGESTGLFPATPATPTAFETRNLGKVVEVEPTVSQDNKTVNLNITADFTDFVGFINYGTPIRNARFRLADGTPSTVTENRILMPVFDVTKETTNVSVWDGQTVAIGGLHQNAITDGEDKVPYLGDLPVLGSAFRSSTRDTTRQAVVIFVSVRLIDPGGNPINPSLRDVEFAGQ